MTWDPRYLRGIEHFNRREFYDAHEVWEDLWNSEVTDAKAFVQGLIQFATALHHFEDRNFKGARVLFDGGVALLRPYAPVYWGLPVGELIESMRRCVGSLVDFALQDLPGRYDPRKETFPIAVDPAKMPVISLQETNHGS